MKQTRFTIHAMAALLLMGAVFTGCSDDLWFQNNNEGTYTLSVETSKSLSVTTRALSLNGSTLTATWSTDDNIYVMNGSTWASGSLQPQTATNPATLKGSLSNITIAVDDELTLQFPKSGTPDYSGQKGTLADIAANFDYATTTATVTAIRSGNVAATATTFTNQQAIVKFTLLDKGNSDAAFNPTSLTVSDGTSTVSLTDIPADTYTTNSNGILYVAFPAAGTAKTITLTATDGSNHYSYEKSDVTFTNGNYYDITVKMTNTLHIPLTFEAKTAGAEVTFTIESVASKPVQYSTDGSTWQDYSSGTAITLTNVGDKVSFRGANPAYATNTSKYSTFSCSADCYIYGNVMSLVSSTNYANITALSSNYAFLGLFKGNEYIVNHPSKTLVLPATTLSDYCYREMFYGCTSLTIAPELPARTLTKYCYYGMFSGCTNLTTAPELPATTLANYCYYRMFEDCTNLTSAPALPATTLTTHCYYGMFSGCTNLTTVPDLLAETLASNCCYQMFSGCSSLSTAPALPATTLADNCYDKMFQYCTNLTTAPALTATALANSCYQFMFKGCTSLTTAPALPATSLTTNCYNSMFYGCTNLTTAPTLPATSLVEKCYNCMFFNCSNLNSLTCLATNMSASNCTNSWLYGVAETGTFSKNVSTPVDSGTSGQYWPTNSTSGIPSGWTIFSVLDLSTVTAHTIVTDNSSIIGTLAGNYKISIADGATVMLNNATINGVNKGNYAWAGLNCEGDATIILSGTNTVKGFQSYYPGIHIPEGYTLTIQGTGTLNASSNGGGAGIGGGWNMSCGSIIINSGTISASGGARAAGIGGGGNGSPTCGDITINGGTITAYGGDKGAGIGGGGIYNGGSGSPSCGNISISGGTVTAHGGNSGAGIGSGGVGSGGSGSPSCGTITISGGTIEATAGNCAAGIGSGAGSGSSTCGAITISGGTITANGGYNGGTGIGSGLRGSCPDGITITNTVTRVTATKAQYSSNSIGAGGSGGSCGTITIGGSNVGNITTSPYTYEP